jgi:hypothetical protein
MATFLDKLKIFEKEQVKAITASFGSKPKAAKIDIDKLRSWIEAHKDVKASGEVKAKLFAIIEKYNRAHVNLAVLQAPLKSLLEDLLRYGQNFLDEDGLNKVQSWLDALEESSTTDDRNSSISSFSRWSIEAIDLSTKLVSLVSVEDPDVWKEDQQLPDEFQTQILQLKEDIDQGLSVIVEFDDAQQAICRVIRQDC